MRSGIRNESDRARGRLVVQLLLARQWRALLTRHCAACVSTLCSIHVKSLRESHAFCEANQRLSCSDVEVHTRLQVKPRPPLAEPTAGDPEQRQKRGPTKSGYSIVSIGAVCFALRMKEHVEVSAERSHIGDWHSDCCAPEEPRPSHARFMGCRPNAASQWSHRHHRQPARRAVCPAARWRCSHV